MTYRPPYTISFDSVSAWITLQLAQAPDVMVGEWQSLTDENLPMINTIEVEDVSFRIPIDSTIEDWQGAVHPNLPWAEEHFQERVSGIAYNPPPSHVRWPFAQRNNAQHTDTNEKFSHTYPERIWPPKDLFGIRHKYGNLDDLLQILTNRPGTRQAYLPIWYPEDLAASSMGERVPCTLGYHFLLRDGKLKCTYYIRSCDFYRHFNDDVYMAGRLCQWIAEAIEAEPSYLVMHISSMHIFAAERGRVLADTERSFGLNWKTLT
jgi:thymidylate synthase